MSLFRMFVHQREWNAHAHPCSAMYSQERQWYVFQVSLFRLKNSSLITSLHIITITEERVSYLNALTFAGASARGGKIEQFSHCL